MSDQESDPLARISRLEQAAVHLTAVYGAQREQIRALAAVNTALMGELRGSMDVELVRERALGAFTTEPADAVAVAQVNAMLGLRPPETSVSAEATVAQTRKSALSRFRVIEGG